MCREVRRQTCDLISLLEMAQPLSHYYVFMEDDFRSASGPAQKAYKGIPEQCRPLPTPPQRSCMPVSRSSSLV